MRAALLAGLLACLAVPAAAQSSDALWQGFLDPPADARPMVRWWWFGPAVTDSEIDREIAAMQSGGFGGFEVQPVYPLAPDSAGLRNLPYLSPEFLAALRHAAQTAKVSGMRIDVTLGSGWPFGGPHIPVDQSAANVRMERIAVPAGAAELILPATGPGESLLAAMIGPAREGNADRPLTPLPADRIRVAVAPADAPREALVFVAGRTGQQVKRAAVGAEGFVLDHIDPAAITNHLANVGEPLLSAFAGLAPPYAVFSDSLEAYGSSWTGDLPAEFARRRGYDLRAHLPALFLNSPDAAAVRFDWARTLSELVDERYLAPIDAWAKAHGTRFRAQVYGFPPPTLSSNALVALPEGEGADWRSFTSTRWATSAAHLYGKPVVSSEVWTWLRGSAWAATPLDMKIEADRHFLQGVTQLVGHGWPYSAPGIPEPGWAFYAAAALNDHNPWYAAMPDVTRYLQRVSWLLRQGTPANSVAIYLPTEDAFANMRPERASVNEEMRVRVPESLIGQVLDAGFGFDFIDAAAIRARGIHHRVLLLPPMQRIDPQAYRAIFDWVKRGGHLVALGDWPNVAGGLRDRKHASTEVARLSRALGRANGVARVDLPGAGAALKATAEPEVRVATANPAIGFVHRALAGGDLYFVVNSGNTAVATTARFEGDRGNGSWWDPMTGRSWGAGTGDVAIDLAPYQSRVLVFSGPPQPAAPSAQLATSDLASGWTLTIDGRDQPVTTLSSWTGDPGLRFFSGTATYRRTLNLPVQPGGCAAIDFGATSPVPVSPGRRPGMAPAGLEVPVHDVAIVFVNGMRAGSVWAPPYRIDITRLLRAGDNAIEVRVANTALNALAGRPAPDYRLLGARYGERFQAQDFSHIAPQPSGLVGAIKFIEASGEGSCAR